MLRSWGVNTIVLMGAWTDDCIVATVFDAVDKYGFDVVLVTDAIATATKNGQAMMECMSASVGVPYTADEVCAVLTDHPELTDPPQAPLVGSVRFSDQPYVAQRS